MHHRRCDICGCELAIPDIGVYSRQVLNTVACTACSNTKKHLDFLKWVESLRKTYTKKEILELIEDGLNQIWGYDVSIFTVEEWDEQIKPQTNCGTMGAEGD